MHNERLNCLGSIFALVSYMRQLQIALSVLRPLSVCAKGTSKIDGKWSYQILVILQFAFVGTYALYLRLTGN
jgi:hypothetical protein